MPEKKRISMAIMSLLSDFKKGVYQEGYFVFSILMAASDEEFTEDFINGFN